MVSAVVKSRSPVGLPLPSRNIGALLRAPRMLINAPNSGVCSVTLMPTTASCAWIASPS
jgi:hypothetical protein